MKRFLLPILALLILLSGNLPTTAQSGAIRVGSKNFAENEILGQIILVALQNAGYAVEDQTALGDTNANRSALLAGSIDVYPEYTGTSLVLHFQDQPWVTIPDNVLRNPYLGYASVSSLDAAINDLIWLQPAPANNTFALVVTREFSETNGIITMADFADYVNGGGQVLLVASEDFALRPDGLPLFEATYGFDITGTQMLVIAGAQPAITEQALFEGVNGINVAMAYGTDGALLRYDFVVLSDDLNSQPIYNPAPVFRGEIVRAFPEIVGILNPIFATLDAPTLQGLNVRVEVDGESARAVATSYLEEKGFIPASE